MSGNLDQSTKSGKRITQVHQGMFYTLLSRAKSRDKVQLLNFDAEKHIKVNTKAIQEMERMRNECLLSFVHPLKEMNGENICLFNIRSWNAHIDHFLSDEVYANNSILFCFTETHTARNNGPVKVCRVEQVFMKKHCMG